MKKIPCVYILASRKKGAIYVGVTSHPIKRVWQHRNDFVESFTRSYRVHMLVWYEIHATMESAIRREKAIKHWRRCWKEELIEKQNPDWKDLFEQIAW